MAETQIKTIQPQPGYQLRALSSPADIIIGGAAAGVGKTFTLLLDFLRHIKNPQWGGVIFRRTSPQIRNEGGLWDTSMSLYPHLGAIPAESKLGWQFKSGSKLKFSHLEYEKNVHDWQGAQIPFIGFDELTHFTEKMFFYLMTRNRSTCGVRPVMRATCNPDPGSWVHDLISWWIDTETGLPIPERDGVIRWFVKVGKLYVWGNSFEEVFQQAGHLIQPLMDKGGLPAEAFIKSITFISGSIYDNKELLSKDPAYLGNLFSQDDDIRSSLLDGSWKMPTNDKDIYPYISFLRMFDSIIGAKKGKKCVTADIALEGADKFIIGGWDGKELVDIDIMLKSNGPEVIARIKAMAQRMNAPNQNICYDADGVGGFVEGYIPGAVPFNNGGTPKEIRDPTSGKMLKEPYKNWKTQCYYRSGKAVVAGEYTINAEVANRMYDDKMTVRQRFIHERKAIKRDKQDMDGKLCINTKADQKLLLGGQSPDLMDMFMEREALEMEANFVFKPREEW